MNQMASVCPTPLDGWLAVEIFSHTSDISGLMANGSYLVWSGRINLNVLSHTPTDSRSLRQFLIKFPAGHFKHFVYFLWSEGGVAFRFKVQGQTPLFMFRRHSCSNVMNLSGYNHEICGELLKGPKTTISLLAVLHNQIHRFGSKTQKDLRCFGRNHRIYGSHRWLLPLGESPEPGELAQSIKVRMSHRVKEANGGPPCLAVMMGRWKRRFWELSHGLSDPVQERSWWVHPECHGRIICFSFNFMFLYQAKTKWCDSHTMPFYCTVSPKT